MRKTLKLLETSSILYYIQASYTRSKDSKQSVLMVKSASGQLPIPGFEKAHLENLCPEKQVRNPVQ